MLDLLTAALILLLGLSPFLLQLAQRFGLLPQSRWQRRLQQRSQQQWESQYLANPSIGTEFASRFEEQPEARNIEGVGFVIGDLSCRFNVGSPLLRCAVNPLGPCASCHSYESKAELNPQKT